MPFSTTRNVPSLAAGLAVAWLPTMARLDQSPRPASRLVLFRFCPFRQFCQAASTSHWKASMALTAAPHVRAGAVTDPRWPLLPSLAGIGESTRAGATEQGPVTVAAQVLWNVIGHGLRFGLTRAACSIIYQWAPGMVSTETGKKAPPRRESRCPCAHPSGDPPWRDPSRPRGRRAGLPPSPRRHYSTQCPTFSGAARPRPLESPVRTWSFSS